MSFLLSVQDWASGLTHQRWFQKVMCGREGPHLWYLHALLPPHQHPRLGASLRHLSVDDSNGCKSLLTRLLTMCPPHHGVPTMPATSHGHCRDPLEMCWASPVPTPTLFHSFTALPLPWSHWMSLFHLWPSWASSALSSLSTKLISVSLWRLLLPTIVSLQGSRFHLCIVTSSRSHWGFHSDCPLPLTVPFTKANTSRGGNKYFSSV